MAKSIYRIPASLDRSFLDHEITLSGGGWKLKPLPMKVLLFWVISIFAMFWVIMATFLKSADIWLLILAAVWWLIATAFLSKYSKTKEMKVSSVSALINYL